MDYAQGRDKGMPYPPPPPPKKTKKKKFILFYM